MQIKLPLLLVILLIGTNILAGKIQASTGFIDVTIFKQGQTVANMDVSIGKQTYSTNDKGSLREMLTTGTHHLSLTYEDKDYFQMVEIVTALPTIVLINLREGFSPDISVETPITRPSQQTSKIAHGPKVAFSGKVITMEQEPVAGARIYVKGLETTGITRDNGEFKIMIPKGDWDFSVVHPKFATRQIEGVRVALTTPEKIIRLSPSGIKLKEFIVTAPHMKGSMSSLLDDRKKANEVVDVMGAEQMRKAGDGSAAAAIRRITGLTLVDSKYPFIRGMGGRYVSTFLNGFSLPSPDPSKRVVPLDMFPTGILQSINVYKTASPEKSGEFAGGHIFLKTKGIPEELFVNSSISIASSGEKEKGLTYDGGDSDWKGYDDGTRDLPLPIKAATSNGNQLSEQTITNPDGFTETELQELGRSFNNKYNTREMTLPISKSISTSVGDSYNIMGGQLGWLLSGLYGDEWENKQKRKAKYQAPAYTKDPYYDSVTTERLIKIGVLGTLSYKIRDQHEITGLTSFLRRTTDETFEAQGSNQEWDGPFRSTRLKWQEREMNIHQMWGHHNMNIFKFDWRVATSNASLFQPDTREYRYEQNNGVWEFASRKGGNKRNFSELEDNGREIGLDLTIPFDIGSHKLEIRTGAHKIKRDRSSQTRRYGYSLDGSLAVGNLQQDMDSIFIGENINPDGFVLQELTQASDSYIGKQTIESFYGGFHLELNNTVIISGGVRREKSEQYVKTFNMHDADNNPAIAELDTSFDLPSLNTVWKYNKESQFRISYSQSLARPDFRELSPTPYIDDETSDEIVGNPDLKTTRIDSTDIRWEWYGPGNDSFSLALFHKKFTNPIEVSIVNGTNQLKYDVAESATTEGLEIEWNKGLSGLGEWAKNFKTGGNLAIMQSKITLSDSQKGVQTNNNRPLQGQSPYAINIFLFYDNIASATEIGLIFNQMGPRIATVGAIPFDDIYEQPQAMLDMTLAQGFWQHYKLGFKAKNILQQNQVFKQEGRETAFVKKGREYVVSLSARF